ncbi:IS481 family transposase [Aeromicrobium sp.]|uniref:IS481 family transposase n=1 Tax=Aeromicrobium sp. TaxID=1871063 RepID=UPI0030C5366E
MPHANAPLSETGRLRLAKVVVDDDWPLERAAERFNVSVTTARRWASRYRALGKAGMVDRSSRPKSCPHQLPRRTERRIVGLRVSRRWGPARIAYRLGLNVSTVHRVLTRYGCPPLRWTDPATGVRLRTSRRERRSYEMAEAGDLVHVDIKKLGLIPPGGGHRFVGRRAGRANSGTRGRGYAFIHNAVDDRTRLAYCEILTNERKETAAGFWERARAWFADAGIEVRAVMTDNGSCYKSKLWTQTLGEAKHVRTRPYRPQTNGKVERLNRTMIEEWAYARPYRSESERVAEFATWLHTYNHHRGHTSLKGASPADLVPNLAGQNT